MPIRGLRLRGETYVRLDDVVDLLRKDAGKYLTDLPGNLYAVASSTSIHAEASKLEKTFEGWDKKVDDAEPIRRMYR